MSYQNRSKYDKTRVDFTDNLNFEKLEDRQLLASDLGLGMPWAPEQLWQRVPDTAIADADDRIHVEATNMLLMDVHETMLISTLSRAPMEYTREALNPLVMTLAAPDGSFQQFEVVESPIIADELAERFPDIKTYRGFGVDDPGATLRMDVTRHGFHAQVLSHSGSWYVDPYFHLETEIYASYYRADTLSQPGNDFHELGVYDTSGKLIGDFNDGQESANRHSGKGASNGFGRDFGAQLRTYQTVVAATGEYTQFHGGTVGAGQAAIVTAMNRVNGIYENDLSARMVLVANNSSVVYTNGATDPYTNNNGGAMLAQNQSTVDSVIGSANYDLGHVFSTGGGGIAGIGVIGINGQKARGVTGLPSPIGDPFYVDYVAHEMGHQYGGNHTFNGNSGSCSGGRSASHAYEPGSGSTIQAYAGICGNDNLQSNSDAFFHSESIEEIRDNITTGSANSAATITNTGNAVPTADAGLNYVVPASTPFELAAIGTDTDTGDVLTYSWEQRDLGPQQDVNAGDNGSSPLFRAWEPTTDPIRVFPRISDLLNNTTVIGETLPTTNRTMNFRVVVRDNSPLDGGGVATDDMTVQAVVTGAAFAVTSQNTAASWTGGNNETITWNVAGTNAGLVNTPNVDILFAADGVNYDTVLAAGVVNDGSQSIVVPNTATTQGRVKVKGSGNIFFDINNANIEVVPGGPGVSVTQTGGSTIISEDGLTDTYDVSLATVPAGAVEVTVTADADSRVSLDGVSYSSSVVLSFTNTTPDTVFVEAVDDGFNEGTHFSTISHAITATGDSANYPTSLSIPDIVATVADNDVPISQVLVGVDFGPTGDLTPTNWSSINQSGSAVTVTNLINENGDATPFDITVEEDVDGSWNSDNPTITASTLPIHTNNLTNLNGQIWTAADPLTVTWSDLDVAREYEVYVFGLEGFYASILQRVTITGDGAPIVFNQSYITNDLFVNDQVGDSSRNLSEYAVFVTPNASGQIIIDVDPLAGGNDVVLGGVAIVETAQVDLLDPIGTKFLDGLAAGGQLSDAEFSDDVYYQLSPEATANPIKQKIDLILLAEYFGGAPQSFDFFLEAAMTGGPEGDVMQSVELWNETDSIWELLDTRAATNGDSLVQVSASGDLNRFVHPLTGEVIAKVEWSSDSFSGTPFNWDVDVDQFGWLIFD